MSRSYEDVVADAILEVLENCKDADIVAGLGWMLQRPLSDEAKKLRDNIASAAIRAVAEWNLAYAARARH